MLRRVKVMRPWRSDRERASDNRELLRPLLAARERRGAPIVAALVLGLPTCLTGAWLVASLLAGPFSTVTGAIYLFGAVLLAVALTTRTLWRGTAPDRRAAFEDPLTGLPNRRAFDLFAGSVLAQRSCAMLLVDLDHFKDVNDERGHLEGDRVLARTSRILLRSIRDGDFCARIGGDEFAVLLPDTSQVIAAQVGERLLEALNSELAQIHPALSVSMGVAWAGPKTAPELLVRWSDAALYAAKSERACLRSVG